MSGGGSYLWVFGIGLAMAAVLLVVLLRYRNDWRSYLAIAGALLSSIVARKGDIKGLIPLPDALFTGSLIVGMLFLLTAFVILVLDLLRRPRPRPQEPPQPQGPRPEISYAFRRDRAAWSWHRRVPLILEPPPDPNRRNIENIGVAAFAGLIDVVERNVAGRPIGALYSYEVVIQNTGNRAFRDLPITVDLMYPERHLPPYGPDAEYMIEPPTITPPPGADFAGLRHQEHPVTLTGTCDLLNPQEKLRVRFYTRGPTLDIPEPEVRVVARAEHLEPLAVRCNWPRDANEVLRAPEPDYEPIPRGPVRLAAAHQLRRLAGVLVRLASKIGYRHVVRQRPEQGPRPAP